MHSAWMTASNSRRCGMVFRVLRGRASAEEAAAARSWAENCLAVTPTRGGLVRESLTTLIDLGAGAGWVAGQGGMLSPANIDRAGRNPALRGLARLVRRRSSG